MKKIGLLCLCLASLSLVGCFHIPDEDWLPSKNKARTEEVKNDEEVEQAIDSLMDGFNMISSKLDEENGEESEEITGTGDENINIEETIENEEAAYGGEIANTENENQKIENIIE